jgi:hypothetical protein
MPKLVAALQLALQMAEKENEDARQAEQLQHLGEVEGTLNQSISDYESVLQEMASMCKALAHKDSQLASQATALQGLQGQLQEAEAEVAAHRYCSLSRQLLACTEG